MRDVYACVMRFFALVPYAILTTQAAALSAQAGASPEQAADAITADGIAKHIAVLADDSTAVRGTPSRELTRTAQYIAEQFRTIGLQPGGTNATWFQDYPIVASNRKLDYTASRIHCSAAFQDRSKRLVTEDGDSITSDTTVSYASGAYFAIDTVLESDGAMPFQGIPGKSVVAVSGRQTPATLAQADLRGAVVLYVPAPGVDSVTERQLMRQLYAANHVLVLSRADSAAFVRRQEVVASRTVRVIDESRPSAEPLEVTHWAAYVRPEAIRDCLERAGLTVERLRADTLPTVHEFPGLKVWSALRTREVSKDATTAPNVVGILPGSGFTKKDNRRDEYLVISAHMDRGRVGRGINDNTPGVAALLELAKAFSMLDSRERPRRSIIFLATSGAAKFWGSSHWVNATAPDVLVVANVNLDILGRPAGDSVWVDGLHDVDWPVPLDWLVAQYPELRLTLAAGGPVVPPRSDHFAFVRRRIPSLSFYTDTREASVFDPGTPALLDTALTARIAKLVFFITRTIGNADRRLSWTAEGRRNLATILNSP